MPPHTLSQAIERCAREEWGRILAALTKSLGDLQLAEDCLQDAVTKAMRVWERDGLPRSPAAWLITTARRGAIDHLRRQTRFAQSAPELSYLADLENIPEEEDEVVIPDKRLELIFTCCHPALEEKTQVAFDVAHIRWTKNRRNRGCLSRQVRGHGPAPCPRKEEDRVGGYSL